MPKPELLFEFKGFGAKVNQQPDVEAGCHEVVHGLNFMGLA